MTITGAHIIGFSEEISDTQFHSVNPATNEKNSPAVSIGTVEFLNKAVELAHTAFLKYKDISRTQRADFLRTIADTLESNKDNIVATGMLETGLPEARLVGELARTKGQFIAFAEYIEQGKHLDARIDTAMPERTPLPKPDIRSINRPLGVVGVFGASNFPLAFSTGGGDTASALASGCSVVVRGHNGHPLTSEWVARSIQSAAKECCMPEGVFTLVQGDNYDVSYALVEHPLVKAIGFTGSTYVGRILFDKATSRPEPIPFYGELGSINPVVFCPNILAHKPEELAKNVVGSLTMGAGQFCTNPGLLIAIKGDALDTFIQTLCAEGAQAPEQVMLLPKIADSYKKGIQDIVSKTGKSPVQADTATGINTCRFNLFTATVTEFITRKELQSEIFGPSALVVMCDDMSEMLSVLNGLEGQLTGTIWMNQDDKDSATQVIDILSQKVGRVLFNGFPTGVEVTHAMVHGGPYPASTDSRTTSVGTMAIYRFMRPVCYQQTPQALLPVDLQDENPDKILRMIDGTMTTDNV